MATTQRKRCRTPRNELRSLLPKTAQAVVWEGKKFVAFPDQDVDAWLEDLIDGIEATAAMRGDGPRLSQEDVKKRYGLA